MLSWLHSNLQCLFLITFSFKNDEKCSLGSLPSSSVHFLLHLYSKMMRMLSCLPSVSFLLHSYSKMMRNALWAPFLLQCSFLITFLLKNYGKCSLGALPSSSDHFSLHSHLKIVRIALLLSFPPPVFISYYILIKN